MTFECRTLTLMTSLLEVASENGAVGRATPNRTGAMRESAVSHSSSIESFTRERNTRLHLLIGRFWLFKLKLPLEVNQTKKHMSQEEILDDFRSKSQK